MSASDSSAMPVAGAGSKEPGLENYEKYEKLGEGTYGVVFKARNLTTGKIVALKKIRMENEEQGVPPTTLREIATLRELHHPNIVKFVLFSLHLHSFFSHLFWRIHHPDHRCCSQLWNLFPTHQQLSDRLEDVVNIGSNLYLVFEFMTQDLRRYMDNARGMGADGERLVKSYMYQMMRGIAYCHSHRIMHRDLKPQNLLIDVSGYLKLADFGLARAFSIPLRPYSHEVVTLWYRAPEVLLNDPRYSTPIDVWSAGTIFAEMLTKRPLFPGDSEIDELYRIFQVMGTPNEAVWPGVTSLEYWRSSFPQWKRQEWSTTFPHVSADALDLLSVCAFFFSHSHFFLTTFHVSPHSLDTHIQKMLVYDPSQRITAKASLSHPYFDDLDKSAFSD